MDGPPMDRNGTARRFVSLAALLVALGAASADGRAQTGEVVDRTALRVCRRSQQPAVFQQGRRRVREQDRRPDRRGTGRAGPLHLVSPGDGLHPSDPARQEVRPRHRHSDRQRDAPEHQPLLPLVLCDGVPLKFRHHRQGPSAIPSSNRAQSASSRERRRPACWPGTV